MDANQAKNYVRTFILSDGTNPSEKEFRDTMRMLNNKILDELAQFCDQLAQNFMHTHGSSAPGIAVCRKVKQIILSSKS